MSDPSVALSVIVAAIDGASVAPTLEALLEQRADPVEIIVVANPGWTDSAGAIDARIPVVVATRPALVPHLWGLGMARARGSIVAITIAGCVPEPGWMDAVLTAYAADDRVSAVGGPIVPAPSSRLADRALVFARYGPYLPPVSARNDAEVPGDNGSYRRSAIAPRLAQYAEHGFWEADVNASLRRSGGVLRMSPGMRVRHTHSFGPGAFCRQRWDHGRVFGAARARQLRTLSRIGLAAAAPLTAAVMTLRAARHALRAGLGTSFVATLPFVIVFYLCWTLGEGLGLVRGSRGYGGT